jgi:NurA-like 5'-3' nuclease
MHCGASCVRGIANGKEDGRSVSEAFDAEYKTILEAASSISRSNAISIVRKEIVLGKIVSLPLFIAYLVIGRTLCSIAVALRF